MSIASNTLKSWIECVDFNQLNRSTQLVGRPETWIWPWHLPLKILQYEGLHNFFQLEKSFYLGKFSLSYANAMRIQSPIMNKKSKNKFKCACNEAWSCSYKRRLMILWCSINKYSIHLRPHSISRQMSFIVFSDFFKKIKLIMIFSIFKVVRNYIIFIQIGSCKYVVITDEIS